MPRGASPKREREYEELKAEFKESGRYRRREEEVAARIVNKQRSELGETKVETAKDREGKSPDRKLPIRNYQHLTISQVVDRLDSLSEADVRQIKTYEERHKNRKGLLEKLERIVEEPTQR